MVELGIKQKEIDDYLQGMAELYLKYSSCPGGISRSWQSCQEQKILLENLQTKARFFNRLINALNPF